jgi:hypothetical protein
VQTRRLAGQRHIGKIPFIPATRRQPRSQANGVEEAFQQVCDESRKSEDEWLSEAMKRKYIAAIIPPER